MKQNTFYPTLMIAVAILIFSCQKNSTPPLPKKDLADNFVGRYIGNYRENVVNSAGSNVSATVLHFDTLMINKVSANEVVVHFENGYQKKSYDIKGIVLRDTFMEIPIQIVDNQQLKIGDKCVLTRLQGLDECTYMGLEPTALKFSMDLKFYSTTSSAYTQYTFMGQK